jgi:hypothetical protein
MIGARGAMAAVGGLQGFALWLIYDGWPSQPGAAATFLAASTFVLVSALVVHFARTAQHTARLVALGGLTGLAFAAVSLWVGWQRVAEGAPMEGDDLRLATWRLAGTIALYALGPFVQILQATGRREFPYAELYRHSWNNFFVAALGGLFTGALWLVLFFWGMLFKLIDIDVFHDAFKEGAFGYPMTGAALGYGVAAARERVSTIETLRGFTQTLFRGLLPLLAAVTLGFLASLPFTGLAPLFGTTSAATTIFVWLAVYVLFFNAVYLDGAEHPPYQAPLRRLVEIGTLAFPVLAAIGVYAVWLRVRQYGLTPDRVLASVVAGVLGLYAVGYAAATLRGGEPWLPLVRRVNLALVVVIVLTAFALHTPLFDPIAWSVQSQVTRLVDGRVGPDDFDFADLRFHLGWRGYAALERLRDEPVGPDAGLIREEATSALAVESYYRWRHDRSYAKVEVAIEPAGRAWPAGLREQLLPLLRQLNDFRFSDCTLETCFVRAIDLDGDGRSEELLAVENTGFMRSAILVLKSDDEARWYVFGRLARAPGDGGAPGQELAAQLRRGPVELVTPSFGDVSLPGGQLRVVGAPEYDEED